LDKAVKICIILLLAVLAVFSACNSPSGELIPSSLPTESVTTVASTTSTETDKNLKQDQSLPSQPVTPPSGYIICESVSHNMTGMSNQLFIYPDGVVISIRTSGSRFAQYQSPIQIASMGKIPDEQLQNLLKYFSTIGLDKLHTVSHGNNIGAYFSFSVTSETITKSIKIDGYLPADLPSPLNEVHQELTEIIYLTTPVFTGESPSPQTRLKLETLTTFEKKSYLAGDIVDILLKFTNKDTAAGRINPFPPEIKLLMLSLPGTDRNGQNAVQIFKPGSDNITIEPGQSKYFNLTWDQKTADGKQALPGWYQVFVSPLASRSPFSEPIQVSSSYSNFLIEYPQGSLQRTIELNQGQTVSGLHKNWVGGDGTVRYEYIIDITFTLERIELTGQGTTFYASAKVIRNPLSPPQFTDYMLQHESIFSALPQAYYIVDGLTKNAGTSRSRQSTDGAGWLWGTDQRPLDPLPSDASELVFRIPQYGEWQGPWEFKVPLH
jgi:hypothetical protein